MVENTLKIEHNLSKVDRIILKEILSNEERPPSVILSKKLGIPLTIIQRRRKVLENEFLKEEVFFRLDKFGWRYVDFFISTTNGKTDEVAKDLLTLDPVIRVGKSIGHHTIDLKVETIVKDNGHILDMIEKMKAMDGIRDAVWSEIITSVGRKSSVPNSLIDILFKR